MVADSFLLFFVPVLSLQASRRIPVFSWRSRLPEDGRKGRSRDNEDKCAKNQLNCEKVKYQQRTGSRSYIAQAYIVKQDKYKDSDPTTIDLFEEFHCSKTKCFSEPDACPLKLFPKCCRSSV